MADEVSRPRAFSLKGNLVFFVDGILTEAKTLVVVIPR